MTKQNLYADKSGEVYAIVDTKEVFGGTFYFLRGVNSKFLKRVCNIKKFDKTFTKVN